MRFSEPRFARRGDLPGATGEPAARDRGDAAHRRHLCRPGDHVPARRRVGQGDRAVRGRLEPPAAGTAHARLGRRHRRPPHGACRGPETGRAPYNVLGLLLGRNGAKSDDVAAEFREAIRLRPDFAEAHNNLGLVLIQAGDDEGGIAALREAVRISPTTPTRTCNLGAALTPTDADEADPGAREGRGAGAVLRQSAVQPRVSRTAASPSHGSAKAIEQLRAGRRARAHLRPGAPRARQSLASGRQGA